MTSTSLRTVSKIQTFAFHDSPSGRDNEIGSAHRIVGALAFASSGREMAVVAVGFPTRCYAADGHGLPQLSCSTEAMGSTT